jgi:predicted alpha/beta-fold hydrolase
MILQAARRPTTVPEVWETPDHEVLDVDLLPHRAGQPGVLILHGLEASSRASYVRGMLAAVSAANWNGAALSLRGCGPSGQRLPRTYHAGLTEDVAIAAQRLAERWPRLGLVGFSLGANLTLKHLGESGEDTPVAAAVAVSAPFDLAAVAREIDGDTLSAKVYREHFLRSLRRRVARLATRFPDDFPPPSAVRKIRTLHEYDDRVTATLHGFDDAEDYWRHASCGNYLEGIQRPALMVSSEDDPIIPGRIIPEERISGNSALRLWRTRQGGHVGFVGGTLPRLRFAAEEAAIDFLRQHLDAPTR